MSTLRVSTILDQAGENQSTPEGIANGTAKAWVNFNGGGTVAIRASYNVSSITDNGIGNYTVNFTTAMPDANYAITASSSAESSNNRIAGATNTYSTTSCQITLEDGSSSFGVGRNDSASVFVAIFR
jgi:hypothetical protein